MPDDSSVQKYFEETAREFDEIYDRGNSIFKKVINKVFRKAMYERVALTLKYCQDPSKTVLDIGCGSGRVSLLLAEKGLKVTGIDYSIEMIKLANEYLEKYQENSDGKLNVEFIVGNFMKEFNKKDTYDITLALGVFDYMRDPRPLLEKIKLITREIMIASYPARYTWQMPIRKIWLWSKNCPVYFYTEKMVKELYTSMGITEVEIVKLPAVYFVKASLASS